MVSGLFRSALDLAAHGFAVFPLRPLGRRPLVPVEQATTDPARIDRWWRQWPEANVAIALRASNLVAIMLALPRGVPGIDPREWRDAVLEKDGATATIAAPSRAILLYRSGDTRLANMRLAPLVQLRVERFVLAPPSTVRPSSLPKNPQYETYRRTYHWDCDPDHCPVQPLPVSVIELLAKQPQMG